MNRLKLKSPAKINLSLEILNKRLDGYHNLLSIMQTVSLFDTIKLKKSKTLKCYCNNKAIPSNHENLAVKAAIEFFKNTQLNQGIEIKIYKKIPIKAGLGGGSSNAATVLIGLNQIFQTNLNKQTLCKIAAKIGSDVPFFIFGKTALVSGVGETVTPLKPIKLYNILIIKQKNLDIETKKAFLKHDLALKETPNTQTQTSTKHIANQIEQLKPFSSFCNNCCNNFEKTLNINQINQIKKELKKSGALCALMSGSGSSVFSVFRNKTQAKKASKKFPKNKFLKFICKTI